MKTYSVKSSAKRAAKAAGVPAEHIGLVEAGDGWAWEDLRAIREPVTTTDGKRRKSETKGACRMVWDIAEAYVEEKGKPVRKNILALCRQAGIADNTASRQYQLWRLAVKASVREDA